MRFTGAFVGGIFLVAFFNFSGCQSDGNVIDTVASPIAPAVKKLLVKQKYYHEKVALKTNVFYRAHEYKRAWLNKRRPEKMFEAFVQEVQESGKYGFEPGDYHIEDLQKEVEALYGDRKRTPADISDLDIRITASFFLYTTHMLEGRIRVPGAREFLWEKGEPLENDIALLLKMESASDLRKEVAALHPNHPQYERLQKALKRYRALAEHDTISPISTKIKLKPGESHKEIPRVRRKMELMETKIAPPSSPTLYDEALVKAVRVFQERHGLNPDGILDSKTAALLNTPLKQKAEVIALNLERLRWYPQIKGDKEEIVINVPEFMLRVYRNNREKMKMRVVLGAEYTPTPVFHDTLKYIVFSPTWIVPKSIFETEFLPKLQEDSFHFSTERFRFYKKGKEIDPTAEDWMDEDLDTSGYRVVENPGEANSLGKVKFIMPNDHSIYLHDTPADHLFAREERAYSHGCIRLEKPMDLAKYLLRDQKDWDEDAIARAMEAGDPVQVNLEKIYPVYIVYRTAWVDDNDQVFFFKDIYGHDQRHLDSLQKTTLAAR